MAMLPVDVWVTKKLSKYPRELLAVFTDDPGRLRSVQGEIRKAFAQSIRGEQIRACRHLSLLIDRLPEDRAKSEQSFKIAQNILALITWRYPATFSIAQQWLERVEEGHIVTPEELAPVVGALFNCLP